MSREFKKAFGITVGSYVNSQRITKAKELLMDRNHMTEVEAHRYLQKCSMDSGTGMVETAQMVISLIQI